LDTQEQFIEKNNKKGKGSRKKNQKPKRRKTITN
jgi:hypothetical protein